MVKADFSPTRGFMLAAGIASEMLILIIFSMVEHSSVNKTIPLVHRLIVTSIQIIPNCPFGRFNIDHGVSWKQK